MPTMFITIKDLFVELMMQGKSASDAYVEALTTVSEHLSDSDMSRPTFRDYLRESGFEKLVRNKPLPTTPRELREQVIMLVKKHGGGVGTIPFPACVEAHLPEDRDPTREEIEEAWRICASKS